MLRVLGDDAVRDGMERAAGDAQPARRRTSPQRERASRMPRAG